MESIFIDSNKLGEERNFTMFYGGTDVFSRDQVKSIKEVGDSLTSAEAKTFGGDNSTNRKGNVAWLPRATESHQWIYEIYLLLLNQQMMNYGNLTSSAFGKIVNIQPITLKEKANKEIITTII